MNSKLEIILGISLIIFFLILLTIYIIYLIGLSKLYKKAGKKSWEALIPLYNKWVLVDIAELSWWWFLLVISPIISNIIDKDLNTISIIISLIASFSCYYNISKKLHQETSIAILTTLFNLIMIPILGFGHYKFDNTVKVSKYGPFQNNNNITEKKYCPHCGKEVYKTHNFCTNCGEKLT